VSFPGLERQALLMALDLAGVACSTGSACASGSSEPSPTLVEMGLEQGLVDSALRMSFGSQNSAAQIDEASGRILRVCNELRTQKTARKIGQTPPAGMEKPL
jgi:cysteine desulfurase